MAAAMNFGVEGKAAPRSNRTVEVAPWEKVYIQLNEFYYACL